MNDSLGFKGKLKIYTIDKKTNEKIVRFDDYNKITIGSFDILFSLLSGATTNTISKLIIGDGGILDSTIKTVNFSDHDLYNRVKENSIDEISKSDDGISLTVTFKSAVEFDDDESYVISEAGLFDINDKMFSRKCFSEFIVDNNFSLVFEWSIIFTPVEL